MAKEPMKSSAEGEGQILGTAESGPRVEVTIVRPCQRQNRKLHWKDLPMTVQVTPDRAERMKAFGILDRLKRDELEAIAEDKNSGLTPEKVNELAAN